MFRVFRVISLFLLVVPAALAAPASGDVVGGAPAPVDLSIPQKSTISGDAMLSQGREYRKQIEAITAQVQTQVGAAKKDQDVIRLNCLLDKLTQVKVNGNMMDQALQSLQECVARRDESAELHEYTRVTIINQKAQVLRTEADGCVGAETNYVGPTKVVVETPAGLQENVDQPPPSEPPISIIDRPPPSSPSQ
jgi:hypothetical protein